MRRTTRLCLDGDKEEVETLPMGSAINYMHVRKPDVEYVLCQLLNDGARMSYAFEWCGPSS